LTFADYHAIIKEIKKAGYNLQGRVQFPTGGNADNSASPRAKADSVRFRGRQYSLDGRRLFLLFMSTLFPEIISQGILIYHGGM